MSGSIDIEAFTELYEEWLDADVDDRARPDLERRLRQQYRQAWIAGGPFTRRDVLNFIRRTRLVDGADIVWAALQIDDESVLAQTLVAAQEFLQVEPALAGEAVIGRLKYLAEEGPPTLRWSALHALDQIHGLEPWLRGLAERTEDERVRMTAYGILLRSGYQPAKVAFFDDIRSSPGHFGRAMDLYSYRSALNLTPAEVQELREMLQRYVDNTRMRILEGKRGPVSLVGALARDGLAIDDAAAEAIAHYARTAESASDRRQAVEALAAIGTPRASELLGELAFAELADVAARAREALE